MLFVWLFVALLSGGYVNSEPKSQSPSVSWGIHRQIFPKLPLTESKARSDGFRKLTDSCSGGKFLGHRYTKDLDTAAVLLYDVNGYIAGIQFGIPKSDVQNVNTSSFSFEDSTAFQHDTISGEKEIYFLTAYFVDPNIICNAGRTREQCLQVGTGTVLYLQNGPDPIKDSDEIALYEKDLEGTRWVKGRSSRYGVHYWYDMSEDMSCKNFFPFTIIYNGGNLTNFAFVTPGYFEFSKRFEHPTQRALSLFLPTPVPKCIQREHKTTGGFSIMHVHFTVRTWDMVC